MIKSQHIGATCSMSWQMQPHPEQLWKRTWGLLH